MMFMFINHLNHIKKPQISKLKSINVLYDVGIIEGSYKNVFF